jgi:hypothetical protein
LELHYRYFLLGCRSFWLERRWGKYFVELSWLTFLFNIGLAQFFVGVALSDFPVGLSQFFVLLIGGTGNV